MTLFNWIFAGLAAINFGLLILSMIKKNKVMEKICTILFFPLTLVHPPYMLLSSLPDSKHTIIYTILSLSLITASFALLALSQNKKMTYIAYIPFFAGLLIWEEYYSKVFYIYRPEQWIMLLLYIGYLLILIAALFFSGKKSIKETIFQGIFIFLLEVLNLMSFIYLIYSPDRRSLLLFTGSFLNLLIIIFHFIDEAKFKIKHGMQLRMLLLTASQFLIAYSNVLLFV